MILSNGYTKHLLSASVLALSMLSSATSIYAARGLSQAANNQPAQQQVAPAPMQNNNANVQQQNQQQPGVHQGNQVGAPVVVPQNNNLGNHGPAQPIVQQNNAPHNPVVLPFVPAQNNNPGNQVVAPVLAPRAPLVVPPVHNVQGQVAQLNNQRLNLPDELLIAYAANIYGANNEELLMEFLGHHTRNALLAALRVDEFVAEQVRALDNQPPHAPQPVNNLGQQKKEPLLQAPQNVQHVINLQAVEIIKTRLTQWKNDYYKPNDELWKKKGSISRVLEYLPKAFLGTYSEHRKKQLDSNIQWHVNYTHFALDPYYPQWQLPVYNAGMDDLQWTNTLAKAKKLIQGISEDRLPQDTKIEHIIENGDYRLVNIDRKMCNETFEDWFKRLDNAQDSKTVATKIALRQRVAGLIEDLAAIKAKGGDDNKRFISDALELIVAAQSACTDAAVTGTDNLALLTALHTAQHNPNKTPDDIEHILISAGLIEFKKSITHLNLLKNPANSEALEGALYYRINLSPYVQMGIATKSASYNTQDTDKFSLCQALDEMFKGASIDNIRTYFEHWKYWQHYMTKSDERLADMIIDDYTKFENTIGDKAIAALQKHGYITQNKHYAIADEFNQFDK